MIRTFALFSLATILLAVLAIPLQMLHPGVVVVGGHHHIGSNERLQGDLRCYFAQVTIEEGAEVYGQLFLLSSTLDLRGHVTEDIHAFESDVTLRETSHVGGIVGGTDFIHWTLLLPAINKTP